jgi:hypothetical protein
MMVVQAAAAAQITPPALRRPVPQEVDKTLVTSAIVLEAALVKAAVAGQLLATGALVLAEK